MLLSLKFKVWTNFRNFLTQLGALVHWPLSCGNNVVILEMWYQSDSSLWSTITKRYDVLAPTAENKQKIWTRPCFSQPSVHMTANRSKLRNEKSLHSEKHISFLRPSLPLETTQAQNSGAITFVTENRYKKMLGASVCCSTSWAFIENIAVYLAQLEY